MLGNWKIYLVVAVVDVMVGVVITSIVSKLEVGMRGRHGRKVFGINHGQGERFERQ